MTIIEKLWRILSLLSIASLTLCMHGCASESGLLKNKLDPVTGVTISYSKSPLVFYRNVSGHAAYARDYVQLAPLEVNRSGSFRYYLWLGIWNTLQDSRTTQSNDRFASIVLFVDGEPVPLEIAGWTPEAIGATEHVYLKPVASATDAYYEVTVDQLRLIAEAQDVRVQSTGTRHNSYEPWDNQKAAKAGLLEFLNAAVY